MSMQTLRRLSLLSFALAALAFGTEPEAIVDDAPDLSNPIRSIENESGQGDAADVNPVLKAVEVDLEAGVSGGSCNVRKVPAELGIRSVNAVLLNSFATSVRAGKTVTDTVPRDPFSVMRDALDNRYTS